MVNSTIGFPVTTLAVFIVLVVAGIIIDLYAHKSDEVISLKDATMWSIFWIAVSTAFGGFLYFSHGSETASLFFAGYLLEKTLSVDNLFVFMAIFGVAGMNIPVHLRHRVLYWGIIGAIFFRLIFVAIGTTLMSISGWVEIMFGLIVGYSAYKLMMVKEEDIEEKIVDYSEHFVYKWTTKVFPVWPFLHGHSFFVKENLVDIKSDHFDTKKVWCVTPLFLCLVIIEFSDIVFAFDSVPAVIAVSRDPLIVYSAMIFAILGLRTMYFLLEAMKKYFEYLEKAVMLILMFIAAKLIINPIDHMYNIGINIHHTTSLVVISTLLIGSIMLSVMKGKRLE